MSNVDEFKLLARASVPWGIVSFSFEEGDYIILILAPSQFPPHGGSSFMRPGDKLHNRVSVM